MAQSVSTRYRLMLDIKRNEQTMRANSMAKKLQTNVYEFWTEVKVVNNSKIPLSSSIDGITEPENIAELWRRHNSRVPTRTFSVPGFFLVWLRPRILPAAPLVVAYAPQGSSRGLPTKFRCDAISSTTRFVLRNNLVPVLTELCRVLTTSYPASNQRRLALSGAEKYYLCWRTLSPC